MMKLLTAAAFAAGVVGQSVLPNCTEGSLLSQNNVCDQSLAPRQRAEALVSALNITEKLWCLRTKSFGAPRIGLPAYNWWNEALHGVADAPGSDMKYPFNISTSFPMPLLMSAAFDDELIEKVGNVISIEGRAFGNNNHSGIDFYTPDVNPFRDPRWGRGSETPGEDVARIKGYTRHMLRGLEGYDKQRRVIATCKHYVAYDLEGSGSTNRYGFNAKVTTQDLAEYYAQPFQECARDFKVGSIMCSYNAINGVPACANEYLIETVLRGHWNWTESNNYVVSDCEAVGYISSFHNYTSTNAAGTAAAFNAGMDSSCEYQNTASDIPGAYNSGLLQEATIDRALVRLYEGLIRAGAFDGAQATHAGLGRSDVDTPLARQLALQMAVDGMVLLKNDKQTLPLPLKAGSKVAMIGYWIDNGLSLQGIYSNTGNAPYLHTPVWAANEAGYTVKKALGPIMQETSANDTWTANALAAAEDSDYILYFGGIDTSAVDETKDRASISWPGAQLELIKKLSALGKPLVIVQMGDTLDNTPLLANSGVHAILWANWPGQDGGPAVMGHISGATAPAGRLPVTQYPTNFTSHPITDMHLRPNCGRPGRTYRWYRHAVQEFGTGLHYTTFKPSVGTYAATLDIQSLLSGCKNQHPDTCPLPPLPVSVTNTGERASDYVALAFVHAEVGPRPFPLKTLAAYGRVRNVAPGQTSTSSLPWTLANLVRHDKQGNSILYPGEYTIMLDQPTLATAKLTLTGQEAILDKWPQPKK